MLMVAMMWLRLVMMLMVVLVIPSATIVGVVMMVVVMIITIIIASAIKRIIAASRFFIFAMRRIKTQVNIPDLHLFRQGFSKLKTILKSDEPKPLAGAILVLDDCYRLSVYNFGAC